MNEKVIPSGENTQDEADILQGENQNETMFTKKLEPIEDEPEEFIRGEVDVVEQMSRAAHDIEDPAHDGELASSFKFTPGGIEEVEMVMDRKSKTHETEH